MKLILLITVLLAVGYGYPKHVEIHENPQLDTKNVLADKSTAQNAETRSSSTDCFCVPYFVCNDNNTLDDDGLGVLDIRGFFPECDKFLEKCCEAKNIISEHSSHPKQILKGKPFRKTRPYKKYPCICKEEFNIDY